MDKMGSQSLRQTQRLVDIQPPLYMLVLEKDSEAKRLHGKRDP